jgi:NAD(P)-dependent dehydrogenase (short-subunit alcohol dehydrogenase family)
MIFGEQAPSDRGQAALEQHIMGQWIVTGGASGIGAQVVNDLQKTGEQVVVWDIKPPDPGVMASYEHVDLLKPGSIESAAAKISGGVRGFIHCAGITAPTSVSQANAAAQLRAAFEVHVVSFVAGVQSLVDKLAESKGSVVAITSAAMDVLYPATLAYGPTKAALRRAVEQLAVELGPRGIRVNGVAPGAILTPMTKQMWSDESFAAERRSFIPLGRQAQPSAISNLVLFLVSDAADYITGEVIYVDGGVRHGIFNTAVANYAKPV